MALHNQQGGSHVSGANEPVQQGRDPMVPIAVAWLGLGLVLGLAGLVVISATGGSIALSTTGLIVSVNTPQ
jgi:hypothetical protein